MADRFAAAFARLDKLMSRQPTPPHTPPGREWAAVRRRQEAIRGLTRLWARKAAR